MFRNPLVRLHRLPISQTGALHTDEVRYRDDGKLLLCSYKFGVIDAANPASMSWLAEGLTHTIPEDARKPGCMHLAWDGDIVYTTHRGNAETNPTFLTAWDISKKDPDDPNGTKLKPEQLPVLQEPGVSYEGVDVANDNVYVGLHGQGLGVYRRDAATNEIARIGTATGLTNAWGVVARGDTVYVADGLGGLATVDVTDPANPKVLGAVPTGGMARGLVVEGDIAYVASGSAGLVVVDVADLAAPKVVGTAAMPGFAIRTAYADGRVYVAAYNDVRAFDVASPAEPRYIGAVRIEEQAGYASPDIEAARPPVTSPTFGVAAVDDIVFVGNWWTPYAYRVFADRAAPHLVMSEDANTIDFGQVAPGESKAVTFDVANHGTAPLTLFNNWVEGSDWSVTPRQVQLAAGERTALTVAYAPTSADPASSTVQLWSDDPSAPVRIANVVANRAGLGIGQPLPETRVALLDGNEWTSSQVKGNVTVLAYFATF